MKDQQKTPRRFRNELYAYLTANDVTEDTAARIASHTAQAAKTDTDRLDKIES